MPSKTGYEKAMAIETARPAAQLTEWISIATAAERCEVSAKTIRRWIAFGYIRARRFGPKLIRIDAATLEQMSDDIVWAGSEAG